MMHDIFLSHSSSDKEVARRLLDRLSAHAYRSRKLRVWFDEERLNPGEPSSERELHSALERSRFLVILLSPAAVRSKWVQSEIEYFNGVKSPERVVVLTHNLSVVPQLLSDSTTLDWAEPDLDESYASLLDVVCPKPSFDELGDSKEARRSVSSSVLVRGDGYDTSKREEDVALVERMFEFDIGNLDDEGPARSRLRNVFFQFMDVDRRLFYNSCLVMGEVLALALLRHPAYRRAAHGLLEMERQAAERVSPLHARRSNSRLFNGVNTNIAFALARAESKVAELDPSGVDLSTLWDILHSLDGAHNDDEAMVHALISSRALGKLRTTAIGELLIYTLARSGGWASRVTAAWAIASTNDDASPPVYTTAALEDLAGEIEPTEIGPPSPLLASLLTDGVLDDATEPQIAKALSELDTARIADDDPRPTAPSPFAAPVGVHNGPIVGTIRAVTIENMEELSRELGPTDIAFLTEDRIVESLLDNVGAFVMPTKPADSPQLARMKSAEHRFAMFEPEALSQLIDGSVVSIFPSSRPGFLAQP